MMRNERVSLAFTRINPFILFYHFPLTHAAYHYCSYIHSLPLKMMLVALILKSALQYAEVELDAQILPIQS